jgi:hypothetical protein
VEIAGQCRALDTDLVVYRQKTHGFDLPDDRQPLLDVHRKSQPLFADQHRQFPSGNRQNHDLPACQFPFNGLHSHFRELAVAPGSPPEPYLCIQNDHRSVSQSSSATGAVGSS